MPSYREISIPGEARPRRRSPAGRADALGWRGALGGAAAGIVDRCRSSPGPVLGSVAAVAAAGLVCLNALGHQDGRHPAPILPKLPPAAGAQAKPPPRAEAAARDGLRPDAMTDARADGRPEAKPDVKANTRSDAKPDGKPEGKAAPPRQAARDAIGDLIRADETTASVTPRPSARPPRSSDGDKAGEAPVLQAQRALAKLGYGAIKADGMMGASTRAAIESFERKAKLPVTGEAAGRTLRALVARAAQG